MKDNDFFYLKEIAWSAFRGANKEARTVFYSRTGEMEDAKNAERRFLWEILFMSSRLSSVETRFVVERLTASSLVAVKP
jgi:hypothetical protein